MLISEIEYFNVLGFNIIDIFGKGRHNLIHLQKLVIHQCCCLENKYFDRFFEKLEKAG